MGICLRFKIYKCLPFLEFQDMMLTLMTNYGFDILCFVQDQNYYLKDLPTEQEKNIKFMEKLSDIIQRNNGNIKLIEDGRVVKSTTGLFISDMGKYFTISGFIKGGNAA